MAKVKTKVKTTVNKPGGLNFQSTPQTQDTFTFGELVSPVDIQKYYKSGKKVSDSGFELDTVDNGWKNSASNTSASITPSPVADLSTMEVWSKANPEQFAKLEEAGFNYDSLGYNGKMPDAIRIGKDGAGLGELYRNSDGTVSQVSDRLFNTDISKMNQAEFTDWASKEGNATQAAQLGNDIKFNDAGTNVGTGMNGTESPNWMTRNAKGLEAGAAVAGVGLGLMSYLDQRSLLKKQKELLGQQIAMNKTTMAQKAERDKSLGDIRLV